MGVSGPSLGLTFSVAAISQLADIPADPSVVMTGKVDIKGNVGPIGGVGWRGAGKFLAASRARRIKIKKFLIPTWNFERASDEVDVLREESIQVIPVQKQIEAWREALGSGEDEILARLHSRIQYMTPLTP
jgi:predicted ATP-dependent protease